MRGRTLWVGTAVVLCLAIVAGCSSSPNKPPVVTWDMRKGRHIGDLGISENTLDIHDADVAITAPNGQVFTGHHILVQVDGNLADPTLVEGIRLRVGDQTIDQAYETGRAWCAEWGIPTDALESWHVSSKIPASYDGSGAGGRDLTPGGSSVGIYMAASFDQAKPVRPELGFYWSAGPLILPSSSATR